MNIATTRARHFGLSVGKIAMAISVGLAIGGLGTTPAFGDEYNGSGYVAPDRGHDNGHNNVPIRRDYRPKNHHPAHYAHGYAPTYTPPPVYYAPQPSAGISLFIPLDFH